MAKGQRKGPAKPTSPAASGPAGPEFEAEVGASYLLALLAAGEPRGLPGTIIDSVAFQRAAEGHPLDDVVVGAHDPSGAPASLEVQVKRSIQFTASDQVFASVVAQMLEAAGKPGFWDARHELAVATARTSSKIDAYQDVLTWARQLGASDIFAMRIARAGSANDDMRAFVGAFKKHLRDCRSPDDDETVWKLLRRFQILIFDFTAQGSASEALARERAARALDPSDAGRGGDLWTALVRLALGIAAAGGDRSRETLRSDPTLASFRWIGDPRHPAALAALAEAGRDALADIKDEIGAISIARPDRIAEVHEALQRGRYVEIRGDAGVGKSGILKHFARQAATERGVIVLSPGRTTPRGWTSLRSVLRFEGSSRDLLVELAADGTAILFIDNLDFFTAEEQATVNDLVRAAAEVPGFSVVATGRREFGGEELAWLPAEALKRLGRTPPIVVDELNETEVGEIAAAAPALAPLLASGHPAKDVTRNLFRLARLAARPQNAPILRTEADMADEWWETADGESDGRRERGRVLRSLAEQALGRAVTFDVRDEPPSAVDALIRSETLRDYGDDRVGFRHDVLREWAIAKLFAADPAAIKRLPLANPAPAYLARGLELYARSLIEGADDDAAWSALLTSLSDGDIHDSWRRAILLALVRSEASPRVLTKAHRSLLADNGALLNRLIRVAMAVDVQPASVLFEGSEFDVGQLPAGLTIPSGLSWYRLITWTLAAGDRLPAGSIPDVVDLYGRWIMGMLGSDPLTPMLLERLHHWLMQIETAQDARFAEREALFGGVLSSDQIRSVTGDLRRTFAIFAARSPEHAATYLRAVRARARPEGIGAAIHEMSGALPAAAPAEFAALMEALLIPAEPPDGRAGRRGGGRRERAFTDFDSRFLPISPAQGGLLTLLTAAPEIGKAHIRRLVDHALAWETRGITEEPDAIEIALPDGVRRFLWSGTYLWAREAGSRYYAASSGLMALEAWAHRRVEGGEPVKAVIADILGPGDHPAAYLLLCVDLILSHWPASRDAAIPFLASPELIILDRSRIVHEGVEFPDYFGLKAIEREPVGLVSAKDLSSRASRKHSLHDVLRYYALAPPPEHRARLVALLQAAAKRLGPPAPETNLGDPEFMVVHLLNVLNPENWQAAQAEFEDGSIRDVKLYVAPQSEEEHLGPRQAEANRLLLETRVQQAAAALLQNPSIAAPEGVAALADWGMAQAFPETIESEDGERDVASWSKAETLINIAMIVMRDGDPELRERTRAWAHDVLDQRLRQPHDRLGGMNERLQFNALGIALAGFAFSLRDQAGEEDVRRVLDIAAHSSSAGARGFAAAAQAIAATDGRLLKSILRCAMQARIYSHRDWNQDEEVYETRKVELRQKVDAALQRELDWLAGRGEEPSWPHAPLRDPHPKRGLRLPPVAVEEPRRRRRRADEDFDYQGAAMWLAALKGVAAESQAPWLRELIGVYAPWTANANGAGLDEDDDIDQVPSEWNQAYFGLAAACLPGLGVGEIDGFVLDLITGMPAEAFIDASAIFLRATDVIYLDAGTIDAEVANHIRAKLAQALRDNRSWTRFAGSPSSSVERHIADTVSAMLFHTYSGFAPPACYLFPHQIEKLLPLLPTLQTLAVEAPNHLVAIEVITLLEVAPKPEQFPFAVAVARAWTTARPDDTNFWVDYAIGRKLCQWLEAIREQMPSAFFADSPLRADVDFILAALVRVGVADAGLLEAQLPRS